MINDYQGPFSFTKNNITNWQNTSKGVYYLWEGKEIVYVGSATSTDGIRGRLLSHVNESNFPSVTDFGYKIISTNDEILRHEESEIKRLFPRYNKQHNS